MYFVTVSVLLLAISPVTMACKGLGGVLKRSASVASDLSSTSTNAAKITRYGMKAGDVALEVRKKNMLTFVDDAADGATGLRRAMDAAAEAGEVTPEILRQSNMDYIKAMYQPRHVQEAIQKAQLSRSQSSK